MPTRVGVHVSLGQCRGAMAPTVLRPFGEEGQGPFIGKVTFELLPECLQFQRSPAVAVDPIHLCAHTAAHAADLVAACVQFTCPFAEGVASGAALVANALAGARRPALLLAFISGLLFLPLLDLLVIVK
jgi:hypothetical protein